MDSLHQLAIDASPEAIFDAITTEGGIQGWWSQFTSADPTVGGRNEVTFYGGMVSFDLRNEALIPGQEVVWAVEGGPPPWIGTRITWRISPGEGPNAGQMVVDLAHRGLEMPEGAFASINYTWGWYLTSLRFYLEKGEGMPHTAADMAG